MGDATWSSVRSGKDETRPATSASLSSGRADTAPPRMFSGVMEKSTVGSETNVRATKPTYGYPCAVLLQEVSQLKSHSHGKIYGKRA